METKTASGAWQMMTRDDSFEMESRIDMAAGLDFYGPFFV